jgi:hypothetical protein
VPEVLSTREARRWGVSWLGAWSTGLGVINLDIMGSLFDGEEPEFSRGEAR